MRAADTGNWLDFGQLATTRAAARASGDGAVQQKQAALRGVARQFEAVFINSMLESMRAATPGDPLFGSSESEDYRDMLDHQLSLELAGKGGIGIADMLVRQLSPMVAQAAGSTAPENPFGVPPSRGAILPLDREARADAPAPAPREHRLDDRLATVPPAAGAPAENTGAGGWRLVEESDVRVFALRRPGAAARVTPLPEPAAGRGPAGRFDTPEHFVRQVWPHAEQVAGRLGVDPGVLVAQAALETGWGQHVIRARDGASSHNLFGIKADERWNGPSVSVTTLEHENGVMRRVRAPFRAYDSLAASFEDYARFVGQQGRYRHTLEVARASGGDAETYIRSLQHAGYATDPDYADKVLEVMRRTVAAVKNTGTRSLL